MILQATIYYLVFPMLTGALVLAFVRLLRGPTAADRIVAFDLIAAASAGIIVVTAIVTEQAVLLDAASIWAVIAFVSVIAFADYIERRGGI
jgi:multicomponent Na+:H+ antiporter subunit F